MMKQISLLFIVLFFDAVFTEMYIITRRPRISGGHLQPDLVQIPSSLCHNNGTTECPLMDGERHSVCQCICSKKDDLTRLYKSTFQVYNNTWKCAKNAALHKLSGCSFSLDGAGENVLATLPSNTTTSYALSNATTELYITLPVGKTCAVSVGNSAYLKCNGQWEPLNSALITKRFRISYRNPSDGKYGILVWVNSTEHLAYPLPSGRIIRLAVTCSDRPWEPSQCIVTKVQGKLECPALSSPVSSTTTPRPSPTSSTELISTTPFLSTAQPHIISSSLPSETLRPSSSMTQTSSTAPSSTASVPTTISPSISKTSSTAPSSPVLTSSPSSPKPNTTIVPTVDETGGGGGSGKLFSGALIGIILGGIAVLVALVIFIVIIAKQRKKRSNDPRKNSSAAMVVENESYEQGSYLEDESYHPYENVNPSVVPPTTPSAPNGHVKGKADVGGHRSSVSNKVYEAVEELDNQPSKPNTENINEQQDPPTNRTGKEPLPAIPESTMFITFRDLHHYDTINDNNNNNNNA